MYNRIRDAIPFWGFPLILAVLGLLVLGLVLGLGDGGDSGASKIAWNPESKQVVSNNGWVNPNVQNRTDMTGQTGGGTTSETAPAAPAAPATPTTPAAPLQTINTSSGALSPGGEVPGPNAVFVFKGYGRAHGVGLCMDGVRYRAQAGHSCMDIINYYYTGVSVQRVDDQQPIRIKGRDGQVKTLPMKEYLYRLAEEPEDYPAEGLKVLYIAARTYTLSCIARGKHTGQGYDICASGECCQAYNENKDLSKCPNNIAAVDATSGLVLFYNGSPITAAYCGSCGGHTDNNEDVWGGQPLPYLRGKPDEYCSASPRYCTVVEMSASQLQSKLGVGQLKLVDLSDRTPGGRVRNARIVGSAGTKTMSGRDFGKIFGFKGTRYEYSFK